MVDAGAILKLNRSRISVGSSSVSVDRSGGALQVLGVPRLMDTFGNVIFDANGDAVPGSVYFTSLHENIGRGVNTDRTPPAAAPGDWGGIDFRNQIDGSDQGRRDWEREGLFLNSIVHADIRFGGGQVVVDGVSQVITPIHMVDSRPTIANNIITRSADAAMAATPNSFRESNFQDPRSQLAGLFIADYDRVGPDIHGNRVVNNTINGLFVKVRTSSASATEVLAVSGRFDDTDIAHIITENLVIAGTPGGPVQDSSTPPTASFPWPRPLVVHWLLAITTTSWFTSTRLATRAQLRKRLPRLRWPELVRSLSVAASDSQRFAFHQSTHLSKLFDRIGTLSVCGSDQCDFDDLHRQWHGDRWSIGRIASSASTSFGWKFDDRSKHDRQVARIANRTIDGWSVDRGRYRWPKRDLHQLG